MSSQISLVANEPVRGAVARASGSDAAVNRAGGQQVAEKTIRTASTAPEPVEREAPEVKAAVESVRKFVNGMQRDLQFTVDEDSGRTIITVIDSEDGRVVRQIPSEEVLQIADTLARGGSVNLIDSRA